MLFSKKAFPFLAFVTSIQMCPPQSFALKRLYLTYKASADQ